MLGVGLALGDKTLERGGAGDVWEGELAVFASVLSGEGTFALATRRAPRLTASEATPYNNPRQR